MKKIKIKNKKKKKQRKSCQIIEDRKPDNTKTLVMTKNISKMKTWPPSSQFR